MLRYNRNRARGRFFPLFSPRELFYGSVPGAWYDPTDLSTMFQDNTGLTPVTAVEQPVGLIFDKSQGTPAARYNLFTYSEDFGNAYWFKAGGTVSANTTLAPDGTTTADTWTAVAGNSRHEMLSAIGAGPSTIANQNYTFSLYVKKGTHNYITLLVTANVTVWYAATFDFSGATPVVSKTGAGASGTVVSTSIEAASNGFWRISVTGRTTDVVSIGCPVLASSATPAYGGFGEENWVAAGTETAIFWGAQIELGTAATTYQRITSGIGGEWTPGNHAYQSTAASRPTYSALYNRVINSVMAGAASGTPGTGPTSWTRFLSSGSSVLSGSSLQLIVTAGRHIFGQAAPVIANASYRWRLKATVNSATGTTIQDLTFATALPAGASISDYRVNGASVPGTQPLTPGAYTLDVILAIAGTGGTVGLRWGVGVQANATADVTFSQLDFRLTADVRPAIPDYQAVTTATNYDTVGFLPYLAFDGLDDSLSTASINFTATDKMTVFAGVTKSTDAGGTGMVVELSASVSANNGSFYISAPNNVADNFGFASRGTATQQIVPAGYAAPMTSVLTAPTDIAAPLMTLRRNGIQIGSNANSQGTGTFGNYAMFIGRRNNSIYPFNGRIYELIVRGAASSVTEIADTELWVNARTGAF